jgi:DNA repair photolyase
MAGAEVQEIRCKALLNRVDIPDFPFRWTLNPYRGCRYACRYCYARPTHEFWGLDAGREFERRVFAKVNAPEVLRRELRRPKWHGEAIAIGTASDPYEPAESEYQLTRHILQVLGEFKNPASLTTKGVLIRRDVDVLRELRSVADVRVNFSVGSMDDQVWRLSEPGTPQPLARFEAMQFLVENGVPAGVMMAPLLPGISDSMESINAVVRAAAEHKAQFIGANLLSLKPGAKEWFMPLLREAHPRLSLAYAKLYRKTYAPREYTDHVMEMVDEARRAWALAAMEPTRTLQGPQRRLQLAFSV